MSESITEYNRLISEGRRLIAGAPVSRGSSHPRSVDLTKFESWKTQVTAALTKFTGGTGVHLNEFQSRVTNNDISSIQIGIGILEGITSSSSIYSLAEAKNPSYEIALICALHKPELSKVLERGKSSWNTLPPDKNDPQTYYTTEYSTNKSATLRVVAAAPNNMGLSSSSVLATKILMRFRPRLLCMVGIAAGVKIDSQGFGDILAAEYTFDYGSGKLSTDGTKTEFQPDPRPMRVNTRLLSRLKEWERLRTSLDDIQGIWPASLPPTKLQIHVGSLGSGAAVINTAGPIDEILKHWRKLIGIEMEAYGVHYACTETLDPSTMFACFKSICDFAVGKDDNWQNYAAFTAAEFCHRFICEEWHNLFPDSETV